VILLISGCLKVFLVLNAILSVKGGSCQVRWGSILGDRYLKSTTILFDMIKGAEHVHNSIQH